MPFPGTKAGDEASYATWEDSDGWKYFGMRELGLKHGIVRTISNDGWIKEETWYENKNHGLSFVWTNYSYGAFYATIYDHGDQKARVRWRADWSEYSSSGDKDLILKNNGLSIFKP